MHKIFLITGASLGALGVAIGAFGAHKLKSLLLANGRIEVFETAVKYQMYHTLALLLLGIIMTKANPQRNFNFSGYAFIIGILIFSGSLYILSITNVSKWGAVTPIGGIFLITGWIYLLLGVLKMN